MASLLHSTVRLLRFSPCHFLRQREIDLARFCRGLYLRKCPMDFTDTCVERGFLYPLPARSRTTRLVSLRLCATTGTLKTATFLGNCSVFALASSLLPRNEMGGVCCVPTPSSVVPRGLTEIHWNFRKQMYCHSWLACLPHSIP